MLKKDITTIQEGKHKILKYFTLQIKSMVEAKICVMKLYGFLHCSLKFEESEKEEIQVFKVSMMSSLFNKHLHINVQFMGKKLDDVVIDGGAKINIIFILFKDNLLGKPPLKPNNTCRRVVDHYTCKPMEN
jgi:hypothetical protein